MKRVLCILFSLILLVSSVNMRVSAEEKDEFDVYVRDNFYEIASTYGVDPSSLTVEEGLEVINLRNEARYYPVYENGKLIYCLELYKVDGEIGFAFPGNAVDALEQLFAVDDKNIAIFAVADQIFGYTGDYVINFRSRKLVDPDDFRFELPELTNYSHRTVEFIEESNRSSEERENYRTATPSWTTYFRSSGLGYGCVPQTLYNIYRNYGKSISAWTAVGNEMNTANSLSYNYFYNFTHAQIQTYLSWKGVSTTYSATSGKLAYNTCDTVLSNSRFIMMVSSGQYWDDNTYSYQTSYHATALVGTPTSTTIKIADPHGTSNTSNISYSTASFYSSGISYTWNSGYYSHLTY